MENLDVDVKEILSTLINHSHHSSEQPKDRHLSEITDEIKTAFINAGIDSTCGKKRATIVHKFVNGTIIPSNPIDTNSVSVDNMIQSLTLNSSSISKIDENSSKSLYESQHTIPVCCHHCGK